jgi:hypothetical protein
MNCYGLIMLKNLTPHIVAVVLADGSTRTLPSEGVARATETTETTEDVCGVPTSRVTRGEPVGLPAPQSGVWLVVSALAASAAREAGRSTADLLTPGALVRDEGGAVVGCRGFYRV